MIADLYGNLPSCGNVNAFPASGSGNFTRYTAAAGPGQEGGFVAQMVARYGVGGSFWADNPSLTADPVTTWEVWNESNLPHNDTAEIVDPQGYARFLIAVSAAIRGVDPTATVLLGGISFSGAPSSSPKSTAGFLGEIEESPSGYTLDEFQSSFDGVGIHPYAVSSKGPTYEFGGPLVSEERVTEAREILDAFAGGALGEKSTWVAELGWPTEFAPFPEITPTVQANYVTTTMAWLFDHAEEDDIRYAALFDYRDYHPPEGCSEPECWPMYAGMKRLEFLPPKGAPGGSEIGEYKIDRPLRCACKALVSGVPCSAWQAETVGAESAAGPGRRIRAGGGVVGSRPRRRGCPVGRRHGRALEPRRRAVGSGEPRRGDHRRPGDRLVGPWAARPACRRHRRQPRPSRLGSGDRVDGMGTRARTVDYLLAGRGGALYRPSRRGRRAGRRHGRALDLGRRTVDR